MKIMRSRTPLRLGRRNFLRGGMAGLGAIGLAASEQMRVAHAAGTGQPRFVFIYTSSGIHDSWRTGTPGPNFKLGPTMDMFEPWKSRMTVMDGLTTARFSYGLNPHWAAAHCLLGGREPIDYGPAPGEEQNMSSGSQRTFDHLLADRIGKDTPVNNIVLGGLDNNNEQRGLDLSYYGRDMPQRAIHEVDSLFTALFGEGDINPMPLAEDNLGARQRLKQWEQEALGLGQLQSTALRSRLGQQELLYLQQYEHNLRDAFRRVVETDPSAAGPINVAACKGLVAPKVSDEGGSSEEKNARHHDIQLSTLAAALACGRTRVGVAVMDGIRNTMRVTGSEDRHHKHQASDEHYKLWDRYAGKRIVKFLEQLASYPEGDGTVLDNTIIIWSSEISYNATDHWQQYHPVFLFGGLPGKKLKMGHYLQIPYHFSSKKQDALDDTRNRRLHEVYLTIANLLNIPDLGDFADPKYTKGPLDELLT